MKNLFNLLLLFISFYTYSYSQTFEQLNGPYGGRIASMLLDSATGNFLIGTVGSGIYQSTDFGNNWTSLNSGITEYDQTGRQIWNIVAEPRNSKFLMCNNDDHIFISTDGGQNWEEKTFPGSNIRQIVPVYDILSSVKTRYFILTDYGIYVTSDWGISFNAPSNTNFEARFLAPNPHFPSVLVNDGIIYLNNRNTMKRVFRKSTDGGSTWSETPHPDTTSFINSILFESWLGNKIYVSTGNGIYFSNDYGKNWNELTKTLSNNGITGFSNLRYSSDNKQIFVATDRNGIYKGTMAGYISAGNTGLLNNSTIPTGNIFLTNRTPDSRSMYFGAGDGGMFISTDAGANWTNKNKGLLNFYVQSLAIDPNNSDIIYCGGYETGIYKSTDGGNTWTSSSNGMNLPEGSAYSINALAIDHTNSQIIYAGTEGNGLWKSTDAGNNWQQAFSTSILQMEGSHYIKCIIVSYQDPKIVFSCGIGNIFKSTDRGVNWQVSSTGLTGSGEIRDLVIKPADQNIMYCAAAYSENKNGGIWKSTDAGSSWNLTSLNKSDMYCMALAVNNKNPELIFAGTSDGFYISTNGGTNWTRSGGGDLDANNVSDIIDIFIDQRNPQDIYCASGYSGIFKSSDSGKNWKWISQTKLKRAISVFGNANQQQGMLLIGSNGGGVYKLMDPKFKTNKDTISFGAVGVNTSVTDSIGIFNNGFGELRISRIYLGGSASSDFSILSGSSQITLKPGQSYMVKVGFKPTNSNSKTASLFFECNDAKSPCEIIIGGRGILDTKPPTITHTPPASAVTINTAFPVSASAEDASSDIKSFDVYYRITGKPWNSTQKLSIGSGKSPVSGLVNIPASFVTADGFDYRIIAIDAFDNKDTLKVNGAGYISVPASIPSESVFSPATNAGDLQTSYRLFSIPFNFSTRSASSLLGTIGTYKKDWRFRVLQGSSFTDGETAQLEVGKSYFLITKTSVIVKPASPGASSKFSDFDNNGIALSQGWNLIGNPFNFQIPVSNLFLSNGATLSAYSYEGTSGWVKDQPLKAWSGLAVYADNAVNLKFNLDNGVLLKSTAEKWKSDKRNWFIQVIVKDDDMTDQENYFGMQEFAANSKDKFDAVEPPVFDGCISAFFPHKDWKDYPNDYAEDYRLFNEEGSAWDFTIKNAKNKTVVIEFKYLENISPVFNKYLLDADKNITYNLSTQNKIITNSGNGLRSFKIIIGTENYISKDFSDINLIPPEYSLSQNYPNPFNPRTSIVISLPEDSYIRLNIYDTYGKIVKEILNEKREAGYYEIPVDCSNLASGVYFYSISASGARSFKEVRKMILLK